MIEELMTILNLFKTDSIIANKKFVEFSNKLTANPKLIPDELGQLVNKLNWLWIDHYDAYTTQNHDNDISEFIFCALVYRDNNNYKWYLHPTAPIGYSIIEFESESDAKLCAQNLYSVIVLKKLFETKYGLLNSELFLKTLSKEADEKIRILKDAIEFAGPIALHYYDSMSYPNFKYHYAKRQVIFDGMNIL